MKHVMHRHQQHHQRTLIKVSKRHKMNTFLKKLLDDWVSITSNDHKMRRCLLNARLNLSSYPLQITSIYELKQIKGIGEYIAIKLYEGWQCYCSESMNPTLRDIDALKKGDCIPFINLRSSVDNIRHIPTIHHDKLLSPKHFFKQFRMLQEALYYGHLIMIPSRSFRRLIFNYSTIRICYNNNSNSNSYNNGDINYPVPLQHNVAVHSEHLKQAQVILVVDNREYRPHCNATRSICYHLQKLNVIYELRSLSVGDYVWILRTQDGAEIMCDYIIERKTIDDLFSSITTSRYKEQKQRLSNCGIKNVIYLLEGGDAKDVDKSINQALSSTTINDGFMTKRTKDIHETARFLKVLTQRIVRRHLLDADQVMIDSSVIPNTTGTSKTTTTPSYNLHYEAFQSNSKRMLQNSASTVQQLFEKQLTVCPLMSINRSKCIVRDNHFGSLFSLYSFYLNTPKHLHSTALYTRLDHTIPLSLSQQLSRFFFSL